jgi:hypothetical protein
MEIIVLVSWFVLYLITELIVDFIKNSKKLFENQLIDQFAGYIVIL